MRTPHDMTVVHLRDQFYYYLYIVLVTVHIPYHGTESGVDAFSEASQELITIFSSLVNQHDVNILEVDTF